MFMGLAYAFALLAYVVRGSHRGLGTWCTVRFEKG